jgi:hypothetical protein
VGRFSNVEVKVLDHVKPRICEEILPTARSSRVVACGDSIDCREEGSLGAILSVTESKFAKALALGRRP